MVSHGVVLGHIVSRRGIATDEDKVKVILSLEPPQSIKEVQTFMGHMNYYSRFMKGYAELSRPIYGLIHTIGWTESCEKSFLQLKKNLATKAILIAPN